MELKKKTSTNSVQTSFLIIWIWMDESIKISSTSGYEENNIFAWNETISKNLEIIKQHQLIT